MPKLIANLRENILESAKTELLKSGYDSLTIRRVAQDCGIAVGTVYNYFSSKDMLAAAVMLEDWRVALDRIRVGCAAAGSVPEALRALYGSVCDFSGVYRSVWEGYSFSDTEKGAFSERHRLLVRQLAACLRPVLDRFAADAPEGMDVFLVENLLLCAGGSELTFETFLPVVERILS